MAEAPVPPAQDTTAELLAHLMQLYPRASPAELAEEIRLMGG